MCLQAREGWLSVLNFGGILMKDGRLRLLIKSPGKLRSFGIENFFFQRPNQHTTLNMSSIAPKITVFWCRNPFGPACGELIFTLVMVKSLNVKKGSEENRELHGSYFFLVHDFKK